MYIFYAEKTRYYLPLVNLEVVEFAPKMSSSKEINYVMQVHSQSQNMILMRAISDNGNFKNRFY
jgi:glutamate formiminotransferase